MAEPFTHSSILSQAEQHGNSLAEGRRQHSAPINGDQVELVQGSTHRNLEEEHPQPNDDPAFEMEVQHSPPEHRQEEMKSSPQDRQSLVIKQQDNEDESNNLQEPKISSENEGRGEMMVEEKGKEISFRKEDLHRITSEEQDGLRKKRTQQEFNTSKIAQNPFRSKRKVKPQVNCPHLQYHNPDERLALNEHSFRECQSTTKKLIKKNPNNMSHITSWIHHEFFYSNYERPYFEENDFKELLDCLGLPSDTKLTFGDFKQIQQSMGQPKVFSQSYINEERLGLEDTREIAREYSKTQNINILNERLLNSNSNRYYERVDHLKNKTNVLALANCGHFHLGMVLGEHKDNTVVIKFCNVELGVQKIPDALISSEYTVCKQNDFKHINEMLNQPRTNDLVENMDYFAASLFLKILLIKTNLIEALRDFNQQASKIRQSDSEVPQELKNNTIALVSYLEKINFLMRSVIAAFRLRGSSSYCKQEIAKSISKLLVNPLNFMEKELQSNLQDGDQVAIQQIGEILQTQQQNKVQQLTKTLCESSKCQNQIFQTEQGKLVKNCLAILIGMKMENRPSQLVQNKYMKNISQIIYNHFGQQLNQITECIGAICGK